MGNRFLNVLFYTAGCYLLFRYGGAEVLIGVQFIALATYTGNSK